MLENLRKIAEKRSCNVPEYIRRITKDRIKEFKDREEAEKLGMSYDQYVIKHLKEEIADLREKLKFFEQ